MFNSLGTEMLLPGNGTKGTFDGEGSDEVTGVEHGDSDIKADGTDDPMAIVFGGGSQSVLEKSGLLLFLRTLQTGCDTGK